MRLLTFLLAGAAFGQTVLAPLDSTQVGLNLAPAARAIVYSRFGTRDFVLTGSEMYLDSPDGAIRRVDFGGLVLHDSPAAAGDGWVYFMTVENGVRLGCLLNPATGARHTIRTEGMPAAAAISAESLALLTANGTIALYSLDSGVLAGKSSTGFNPAFTMLSFASEGRLLAIDWSVPDVAEVSAGGVAGVRHAIGGPEVELSRSKGQNLRVRNGEFRSRIVLAHVPASDGRNLLFLSPYSPAEGLRLVEFDRNWQQTASYRLRQEGVPPGRLVLRQDLLSAGPGGIHLLRLDGAVVTFPRP